LQGTIDQSKRGLPQIGHSIAVDLARYATLYRSLETDAGTRRSQLGRRATQLRGARMGTFGQLARISTRVPRTAICGSSTVFIPTIAPHWPQILTRLGAMGYSLEDEWPLPR